MISLSFHLVLNNFSRRNKIGKLPTSWCRNTGSGNEFAETYIFVFGIPGGEGVLYQMSWIFRHPETVQNFNILSFLSQLQRLDFLVYVEYHTFIIVWISW